MGHAYRTRVTTHRSDGWTTPVAAGLVTAVVGFTSSFAVVLAGLRAVGASEADAASGLLVLSLTMGLGCLGFALLTRRPVTLAWSTPGAALLAVQTVPDGGWPAAVGAFVLTGVALALTGLLPPLSRLVARIPTTVASAMLAGVLLSLCLVPFRLLPDEPLAIGAVVGSWVLVTCLSTRWATPAAVAAALVVMAVDGSYGAVAWSQTAPALTWTTPQWSWQAAAALALPLYLVTMTSQNIPGIATMRSLGYDVPVRAALGYSGTATALGAPLGGHAINLSAIAAALSAGPEAGRDPSRRWVAALTCGLGYLAFGLAANAVVALAGAAPAGLFAAVAGVALLGSFAAATSQALAHESGRLAAGVTLVVAASGVTLGGIGSAFWALVVGCTLHAVTSRTPRGRSPAAPRGRRP